MAYGTVYVESVGEMIQGAAVQAMEGYLVHRGNEFFTAGQLSGLRVIALDLGLDWGELMTSARVALAAGRGLLDELRALDALSVVIVAGKEET